MHAPIACWSSWLGRVAHQGLEASAELLWPSRCAGCDAFVPPSTGFCETCQVSLLALDGACPRCALPQLPGQVCQRCPSGWPLARTWSGAQYGGALVSAILRFKHGRLDLGRPLSQFVLAGLRGLGPDVGLVPVPLHGSRLRVRGYNQASELARFALRQLERSERPSWLCDGLTRHRPSRGAGVGGIAARWARSEGAFSVNRPERIRGRPVVLIDDVLTTGATLVACATTLLEAGAREVSAVTVARAV